MAATLVPTAAGREREGTAAVSAAVVLFSVGNLIVRASALAGPVVAFYRFVLVAAVLAVIARRRGRPLTLAVLRTALPGGMALGFNLVFFFSALQLTSVAHATLVANLAPFVVMLFSWRLFGEWVQRTDVLYGTIAAGGMMLVLLAGQGSAETSWSGAGLAALALLAWSAYLIFSKRARLSLDTVSYLAAASVIGAAVTLPVAAFQRGFGTFARRELVLVALLALLPNSGHLLINWAHGRTPIIVISLLMLAVPVLSILGAWVLFDQVLGSLELLGTVVSLGALALLVLEQNRFGSRRLRSHA